jgi:hypothetical protein
MSSTPATHAAAAGTLAAQYPAALTALGHALAAAFRRAFVEGRQPALDHATLRHLGVSRSEGSAVDAEAEGRIEPTRRRSAAPRRPEA